MKEVIEIIHKINFNLKMFISFRFHNRISVEGASLHGAACSTSAKQTAGKTNIRCSLSSEFKETCKLKKLLQNLVI